MSFKQEFISVLDISVMCLSNLMFELVSHSEKKKKFDFFLRAVSMFQSVKQTPEFNVCFKIIITGNISSFS